MTKEVLYITDFTDSSKEALKWSIWLAKVIKTKLTILYTYRLFKNAEEVVDMKNRIEKEASKMFVELEAEHLIGKGIVYGFKTEVGFIADRVEERTKNNCISYVVMGKGLTLRNKETVCELMDTLQVPFVIIP